MPSCSHIMSTVLNKCFPYNRINTHDPSDPSELELTTITTSTSTTTINTIETSCASNITGISQSSASPAAITGNGNSGPGKLEQLKILIKLINKFKKQYQSEHTVFGLCYHKGPFADCSIEEMTTSSQVIRALNKLLQATEIDWIENHDPASFPKKVRELYQQGMRQGTTITVKTPISVYTRARAIILDHLNELERQGVVLAENGLLVQEESNATLGASVTELKTIRRGRPTSSSATTSKEQQQSSRLIIDKRANLPSPAQPVFHNNTVITRAPVHRAANTTNTIRKHDNRPIHSSGRKIHRQSGS